MVDHVYIWIPLLTKSSSFISLPKYSQILTFKYTFLIYPLFKLFHLNIFVSNVSQVIQTTLPFILPKKEMWLLFDLDPSTTTKANFLHQQIFHYQRLFSSFSYVIKIWSCPHSFNPKVIHPLLFYPLLSSLYPPFPPVSPRGHLHT